MLAGGIVLQVVKLVHHTLKQRELLGPTSIW